MQRFAERWLVSAVLALGAAAGCAGDEPDPKSDLLAGDDLLVPIPRTLDPAAAARKRETLERFSPTTKLRSAPDKDFYLAIRKSALEQRWFWSVFMKELATYGPSPQTLGTKVVRFREQNGKLYVFDADDRRATSDVFNPDLIIDAYDIVDDSHFHSLPGSGGYILIDPAAGRNRFGFLSDLVSASAVTLTTELSFVQNFKGAADGGHFEQIITAYGDQLIGGPGDVDDNELRIAATLGVNIRRYTETPGFVEVPAPPVTHYFLGEPFHVKNTGEIRQNAVHWAFRPGMQPVKWVISPEVLEIQADPALGGANLFLAIKKGIESWNAVYGYPVFTASLASPNDSFADDHVNYVILDRDTSIGYAYANWRTNPNTGEIRGASVYFGGGFWAPFPDDPALTADPATALQPKPKTRVPSLSWGDHHQAPACVRWAPAWEPRQLLGPSTAPLTGAQKLELFIQHITAHEIGHNLGLRHNFKGSLTPPTSSVMEYNLDDAAFAQPTPGPYDVQAIKFLHGMSPALPTLPFCTDESTLLDPNCVRFDPPTADPLHDYQIADYELFKGLLLDGSIPLELADAFVRIFGTELFAYFRAGTPFEASEAWTAALSGLRAPIPAADLAANPFLGPAADALTAEVFTEILIAPEALNQVAITDPVVLAAIATDGKNILANLDGVRSYGTRRIVIDALKNAQNTDSLLALRQARALIAASLPGLSPVDQALTEDLLARLDEALTPYFE